MNTKTEWNNIYGQMNINDALLDIDKRSPENFIDEIKMEYLRLRLPKKGVIVEIGAGSGRLITRIGIERHKNIILPKPINIIENNIDSLSSDSEKHCLSHNSKNENVCKLVGIDYSHYSAVAIKENFWVHNVNGSAVCGDAFHIPLKDGTVSVVASGGLLEHFNEKEICAVVREMMRILKPGGLFYADIAPKKFSMLRPVILKDAGGYENSFTKKQWKWILYEEGLRNINIFSGLILPPNFYWFKKGMVLNMMYMIKPFITWMIGNMFSDIFGFEYFVFGRKP